METTLSPAEDAEFYICPECNASFAKDSPELKRNLNVVICQNGHTLISLADARELPGRTLWKVMGLTVLIVWLTIFSVAIYITDPTPEPQVGNPLTLLIALGGIVAIAMISIANFSEARRCRDRGGTAAKLAAFYTNAGYAVFQAVPLVHVLRIKDWKSGSHRKGLFAFGEYLLKRLGRPVERMCTRIPLAYERA